MELELRPELFDALLDELFHALESGSVTPINAPEGDRVWPALSCEISVGEEGYVVQAFTVTPPILRTQGWANLRLEDCLKDLREFYDQLGMSRPERMRVYANRKFEAEFVALVRSADGSEHELELHSAEEPFLQRLFERHGEGVDDYRANQHRIRDSRAWWPEANDGVEYRESELQKARDWLTESIESDPNDEWAESELLVRRVQENFIRDHLMLFRCRYTRGDSFSELREFVERWHDDLTRVFALIKRSRGQSAFTTPSEAKYYVTVWFTVDLIMAAALLGQSQIVRDVLAHPAVSHAPYRAVDVMALIHNVPQASGIDDLRDDRWRDWVVHKEWLKVTGASPGRRQAAFEKFVREWQDEHGGMRIGQTQWCIVGAYLAVTLGLDDSAVRDLDTYPTELADAARDAGVPSIPPMTKLAGAWKKPTPPKVLEPAENRQAHTFESHSGELALSDFAALVTPISAAPLTGYFGEMLESAMDAGTVAMLNWKGVVLEEDVSSIQFACRKLGLRVPGRNPTKMPKSIEKALHRFDEWLEPLGVRLLELDINSDDVFVLPVLAEDYASAVDRTVGDCVLRAAGALRE